ncbi:hypothetical protein DFH06DRAFT_1135990 [Mycena polygramma]|nr:hypothetical protein DFH06DRAFT_1135990 [Mycena polygramma]
MPKHHWDLTPGDTNPMEGSHAQDNKAILLLRRRSARQYDRTTARVLKFSIASGVLANDNNSLQARFAAAARRHQRTRTKQAEAEKLDGGKRLKAKLKASEKPPPTPPYMDVDDFDPSTVTPSTITPKLPKLPALDLFPGLPPIDTDTHSDFDYQMALQSDILDSTLHRIAYSDTDPLDFDHANRPLYAVNGDDEVLASDPYSS